MAAYAKRSGFIFLVLLSLLTALASSGAAETVANAPSPGALTAPDPSTYLKRPRASSYIYEYPLTSKISQMYWALSKFGDDPKKEIIDNYLMINECDIYRRFKGNEFEWDKIRAATLQYLKDNKSFFPIRFEFVQPVDLGDYDVDRQAFQVRDTYRIEGIRRFAIQADDYYSDFCGFDPAGRGLNIAGYPRELRVELSQPVTLDNVPAPKVVAEKFIEDKNARYKKLDPRYRNMENFYALRRGYMFMRVKIIAYKGESSNQTGGTAANVLAMLEAIEIYGDEKKRTLFFKKDYRSDRMKTDAAAQNSERLVPDPNPNDWYSQTDVVTPSAAKPVAPSAAIPAYDPGGEEE